MLEHVHPKNRDAIATRVAKAAGAALRDKGCVAPIDVMIGIGWLQPSHVLAWRTQQLACLEQAFQVNRRKLAVAMGLLVTWAQQTGLRPSTTEYVARTATREPLRFSQSGDPAIETAWRTHWMSSELTEAKRARVAAKAQKPPELVAIEARHPDWQCHRCSGSGALLVMEPPGPACLACAGLGGLELVPAGDARLTRRARAASRLTAVVMRWSNARKHYQRIGSLVEPAALAAARASIEDSANRRCTDTD